MQSDQGLHCFLEEMLQLWLSKMCPVKILIRLVLEKTLPGAPKFAWLRQIKHEADERLVPVCSKTAL